MRRWTIWTTWFGTSTINLLLTGCEVEPQATRPTPGSADLCLLVDGDLATFDAELRASGVEIVQGRSIAPAPRGRSDPDANLVELSVYA